MDQEAVTQETMAVKDKIIEAMANGNSSEDMRQFLVFKIGDEEYAIDVLSVQEIVSYVYLTPVPGSQSYMKGLINLRGNILHVIDLAERVGNFNSSEEKDDDAVIIVISFENRKIGIIADMVSDVINVAESSITENPIIDSDINYMQASHIIKIDKKIVVLLRVEDIVK